MTRVALREAQKKRKKGSGGGDAAKHVDDGDFCGLLGKTMRVAVDRRPLQLGELLAGHEKAEAKIVEEFGALVDVSDEEPEEVPPYVHDGHGHGHGHGGTSVVDLDFIDQLDDFSTFVDWVATGASAAPGGAGASSSTGSGGASSSTGSGGIANETLTETLHRLRLQNNRLSFPREVSSVANDDAPPVPVGRLYFIWNRTFKMTCRR